MLVYMSLTDRQYYRAKGLVIEDEPLPSRKRSLVSDVSTCTEDEHQSKTQSPQ